MLCLVGFALYVLGVFLLSLDVMCADMCLSLFCPCVCIRFDLGEVTGFVIVGVATGLSGGVGVCFEVGVCFGDFVFVVV